MNDVEELLHNAYRNPALDGDISPESLLIGVQSRRAEHRHRRRAGIGAACSCAALAAGIVGLAVLTAAPGHRGPAQQMSPASSQTAYPTIPAMPTSVRTPGLRVLPAQTAGESQASSPQGAGAGLANPAGPPSSSGGGLRVLPTVPVMPIPNSLRYEGTASPS